MSELSAADALTAYLNGVEVAAFALWGTVTDADLGHVQAVLDGLDNVREWLSDEGNVRGHLLSLCPPALSHRNVPALSHRNVPRVRGTKTWDKDKARELLSQGVPRRDIAELCGVDRKSIDRLAAEGVKGSS